MIAVKSPKHEISVPSSSVLSPLVPVFHPIFSVSSPKILLTPTPPTLWRPHFDQ
jgi:hypothetical protein